MTGTPVAAPDTPPPIVQALGVSKHFGRNQALSNVSMTRIGG